MDVKLPEYEVTMYDNKEYFKNGNKIAVLKVNVPATSSEAARKAFITWLNNQGPEYSHIRLHHLTNLLTVKRKILNNRELLDHLNKVIKEREEDGKM